MKKVKFHYCMGIGSATPKEEIIEVEDDATYDEVAAMFNEWLFEFLDAGFEFEE